MHENKSLILRQFRNFSFRFLHFHGFMIFWNFSNCLWWFTNLIDECHDYMNRAKILRFLFILMTAKTNKICWFQLEDFQIAEENLRVVSRCSKIASVNFELKNHMTITINIETFKFSSVENENFIQTLWKRKPVSRFSCNTNIKNDSGFDFVRRFCHKGSSFLRK